MKTRSTSAFAMVEGLVIVAIICIVATLAFGSYSAYQKHKAKATAETPVTQPK